MAHNSQNKCIFILADGARNDVLKFLLNKGYLENISKYIVEPGNQIDGVTVFPSTTGPAYLPFLMGKFPGYCNLPGIRWFDRRFYDKSVFSFKRFRSYIGFETQFFNTDISSEFKTIFELVPDSISILNEITRGIKRKNDKTKFLKAYLKIKGHFTNSSDEVDETSGRLLLDALNKNPRLIFSVFLGIDTYSHQYHPFHKNVIDSYLRIDKYIGLLARRLISRGELDNTMIIIGSDHGLTSTHSHFDSLNYLNEKGYKPLYYTNIFKHFLDADSSIMVSGNSMAHYYFKNGSGWENNCYHRDLKDVVQELSARSEIDFVCVRDEDKKINVISERGNSKIWLDDMDNIYYESNGQDPFGYESVDNKLNRDNSLSLSIESDYPDALLQILQLFESPRTGDVIISAKPGFDLRATHENPEHCGSHGSLHKDHMLVPILINRETKNNYARTVDLFPTMLEHLGVNVPENIDGKSLISDSGK